MSDVDRTAVTFGGVTPILRVADIDASFSYYVNVLGFALQWQDGRFGCVSRGKTSIMLCEGDQGQPGCWIYVGISDADALYAEYVASGARIRHPPRNFPWGARELHVFDPDGHVLRLGSDALEGDPPGEWLDSSGKRWIPQPGGGWRAAE